MRIFPKPAALSLGLLMFGAVTASASAGDEHWDGRFGWPGTTNLGYSITTHNGRIYTGGSLNNVTTNATVDVWDGVQWVEIGQFGNSSANVYDLAFVGGTLYAGGAFTNVNGVAAKGLARWDGNAWSSIGFNGTVVALAVDGNNLYAGGVFTNAGAVAATNIACWDGSAWHALSNGLGGANGVVRALAVTNGIVYAGGNFTNSSPSAVTNIARWNGATWSQVGGGLDSYVLALALKGTDLYAAGLFANAGATPVHGMAKWDGANWSSLGSGFGGGVPASLTVFGGLVCVGGSFTSVNGVNAAGFATWNGSLWAAAGAGVSASAVRVFSTGTNVLMGGNFLLAGGQVAGGFAGWDGANWSVYGSAGRTNGLTSLARAFASDGTNIYAGGGFIYAGGVLASNIARWDGTNWHPLGNGLNGSVNANALAFLGGYLYAAGSFTTAGGVSANHIARWDGTNWSAFGNIIGGTIAVVGARSNDLFIGGNFSFAAADGTAFCITRWDGTNFWTVRGGPNSTMTATIGGPGVASIAFQNSVMYLGGIFQANNDFTISVPTATNVMGWDGANWLPLGGGLNTNVNALAVIGPNLYAAGTFTSSGATAINRLAKWDGSSWSSVGGSVVGSGSSSVLAVMGSNLFAGGSITNMGGVAVNRVARWDGTNWSALGAGVNIPGGVSSVTGLGAFGSDLYVGGLFQVAGDKASYNLGRWNETLNFGPAMIQLTRPGGAPAGPFKFTVNTVNVSNYVIETSTNFSAWSPLETNSASPYDFTDSVSPIGPFRFYRVSSRP